MPSTIVTWLLVGVAGYRPALAWTGRLPLDRLALQYPLETGPALYQIVRGGRFG